MLENEAATGLDDELVAETEAPSLDETIRDTLRQIRERDEGAPPPDAPEDANAPEAPARDGKGKFKARAEPAQEPEAAAELATELAQDIPPPPNSWRKEVAAQWNALPPEVRAEVERREADFHKGIEQYKEAAAFGQAARQIIAPYEATIRSLGMTPDRAVGELLAADHRLRYGQPAEKLAYFSQLAQHYGIDLNQVTQQEPAAPLDPQVATLQQQVQALGAYLQQQQMMGQQQERASLDSEIQRFAADPAHGHFETVRNDMAALIQAGLASTLEEAYERAVYANPATRTAMLEQQAKAQREEAAKKAQAAKAAASVNVRSRASVPVETPAGASMEDTIRQTLRRLSGA